jgi:HSP20 family protein
MNMAGQPEERKGDWLLPSLAPILRREAMSYSTREPLDAFTPLREAVNRFLDDGLLTPDRLMLFGRAIPVDVIEANEEYIIEASLTGIRPENVQVTAQGSTVTIRVGRKGHIKREEEGTYLRRERFERPMPEMTRTIALPSEVDPERVSATYEHGVLTVRVAKDEKSKPKSIPLHVAKETTIR